jgi:hypothetical protein
VVSTGPIEDALTSATLSECFNMPFTLERRNNGRLVAYCD